MLCHNCGLEKFECYKCEGIEGVRLHSVWCLHHNEECHAEKQGWIWNRSVLHEMQKLQC